MLLSARALVLRFVALLPSSSSCLRVLGESGATGRVHPIAARLTNPSSTWHEPLQHMALHVKSHSHSSFCTVPPSLYVLLRVCGCAWTRERHRGGSMLTVQPVNTFTMTGRAPQSGRLHSRPVHGRPQRRPLANRHPLLPGCLASSPPSIHSAWNLLK